MEGVIKTFNQEQIAEIKRLVAERYKKVDIAKKFVTSCMALYRYFKEYSNREVKIDIVSS